MFANLGPNNNAHPNPVSDPLLPKHSDQHQRRATREGAAGAAQNAGPSRVPSSPTSLPYTDPTADQAHQWGSLPVSIRRVWWLTPPGVTFTIATEIVTALGIYTVLLLSAGSEHSDMYIFQAGLSVYIVATLCAAVYLFFEYQRIQQVEALWGSMKDNNGIKHPGRELALAFIENNGLGEGGAIDKIIGEKITKGKGLEELESIAREDYIWTRVEYVVVGVLYTICILGVVALVLAGSTLRDDSPLLCWTTVVLIAVDSLCFFLCFVCGVPLCFCFPRVFSQPGVDKARVHDILKLPKYQFGLARDPSKAQLGKPNPKDVAQGVEKFALRHTLSDNDRDYRKLTAEKSKCNICNKTYNYDEYITELPWCGCHFHEACAEKWLRFSSCPVHEKPPVLEHLKTPPKAPTPPRSPKSPKSPMEEP